MAQRSTPRSAQLRGSKGVVEMEVAVDGDGMIKSYHIIQSSGVPILDQEADLIFMRVGSFTTTPNRKPVQVVIPVRW
jgi:TonB family protein